MRRVVTQLTPGHCRFWRQRQILRDNESPNAQQSFSPRRRLHHSSFRTEFSPPVRSPRDKRTPPETLGRRTQHPSQCPDELQSQPLPRDRMESKCGRQETEFDMGTRGTIEGTFSRRDAPQTHVQRRQVLSAELCRSLIAFANVRFGSILIKRRVFCKSINFEPKDSARLFSEFQFGSSHSCRNADVPTTTRSVVRSFTARISRTDRD